MVRTSFRPGAVFRVPAGDSAVAYAVMLEVFPYVAFYSSDTTFPDGGRPSTDPMFIVLVERSAYSRGAWGEPIERLQASELPPIPRFFWQSPVNKRDCKIVEPIKHRVAATPEECLELEPEAVWAMPHIQSRILDSYAGRPNPFLESLKVRL